MTYRFVELAQPDAPSLEQTVNEWIERGWALEAIRFAPDGRAFVSFVKDRAKRIDLGELDLGEAAPLELEVEPKKKRKKK
jgi:hypothetical protein